MVCHPFQYKRLAKLYSKQRTNKTSVYVYHNIQLTAMSALTYDQSCMQHSPAMLVKVHPQVGNPDLQRPSTMTGCSAVVYLVLQYVNHVLCDTLVVFSLPCLAPLRTLGHQYGQLSWHAGQRVPIRIGQCLQRDNTWQAKHNPCINECTTSCET